MAKKKPDPPAPSELAELFEDFPSIDLLERRLLDPSGPVSLPIRLIDEPSVDVDPQGKKRKWYLRWVNTAMPGRYHTMTQTMGYQPVRWDEISNREQIADRFEGTGPNLDGLVRRGEHGKDLLMKIPFVYYLRIKKRQQELAERRNAPNALKEQLQEEAHLRLGAEAADGVGGLIGDLKEVAAETLRDSK